MQCFRDIKFTNEYYLYSILSMLAEIGGYVGLLLGVSLFNLGHINNVIIDWAFQSEEDKRKAKEFEANNPHQQYIGDHVREATSFKRSFIL